MLKCSLWLLLCATWLVLLVQRVNPEYQDDQNGGTRKEDHDNQDNQKDGARDFDHQFDQNDGEYEDDQYSDVRDEVEGRGYWQTFYSVANSVASRTGRAAYSVASNGATTIGGLFRADVRDTCEQEDGCVQVPAETGDGWMESISSTAGSVLSAAQNATGSALNGIRSSVASEVDTILGAVGVRIATALSPEYLLTKGLSFLPSPIVSTLVFVLSLIMAYVIASFVSIFTAVAFLMAVYLIHAVTGPLWIMSMSLTFLDYTLWGLKCLVFYPRLSAITIGLAFVTSIYYFYIKPCIDAQQRRRKIDDLDTNVKQLTEVMLKMQEQLQEIYDIVQELRNNK